MPQLPRAAVTDNQFFDLRWSRAEADLIQPLARLYGGRPTSPP